MTTYSCTNPDCNHQSTDAAEFCMECGSPLVEVAETTVVPDLPSDKVEIEVEVEPESEQKAHEKPAKNKADLMIRLIRRVKGMGQTGTENTDNAHNADTDNADDAKIRSDEMPDETIDDIQKALPPEERKLGWLIQGDPLIANGYDQWLVKRTANGSDIHAFYRRFNTGSLTNKETYDAVLAAAPSTTKGIISSLFNYGTVQAGGGTRADYEITSSFKGESLHSWLKKSEPSVDKARFLVPLLANLLNGLHDLGLRPITLSPEILSISSNEDCLTLNMLGALELTSETGTNYCAGLSNSALLALPYAAPELIERRVVHNNTETFAIGQIIASAVWGEAQDYKYIRNASVPFASVSDKHIAAILMGTLFPEPEGRWSIDNLNAAINTGTTDFPKCPPWKSLYPGAASAAYTLGGVGYFLAEDLANAIATNWNEAILHLEKILDWLEGTRFKGQVALLRQQKLNGRSQDWILVQLRRLIAHDAPMGWRDLSFEDADSERSLIQLAQKALNGDENAKQSMEQLLAADLRSAFTITPNN
jgi:hypothetical protein